MAASREAAGERNTAEGTQVDERTVIFAFGVGSGVLLGFVLGCFAAWGWLRMNRLMRSRAEWERARREGEPPAT